MLGSIRLARLVLLRGLVAVGLLALTRDVSAQDGTNVLLVVNATSSASLRVALRYARARGVPDQNIVQVVTDTAEGISRERYERDIERPISRWINLYSIQDRILYIVLTKDIPLRVEGTAGRNGTMASVDSELTLLYRKLVGARVDVAGPVTNPYYQEVGQAGEAKPFAREFLDIYLVSRLDGFTEGDALSLIDRGLASVSNGKILLDAKGTGDGMPDHWLNQTAGALGAAGYGDRVVLESTTGVLRDTPNVLGYSSWGSNDPSIRTRQMGLQFVPGAVATLFVSSDARTLKEPPDSWQPGGAGSAPFEGSSQSLVGDMIRAGITGVAGQVAEPYLDGTPRPNILFPAYVRGLGLVDAFYSAIPFLSWQTVVFGDPLCAPFKTTPPAPGGLAPDMDRETELPRDFSARRLKVLAAAGVASDPAKLLLKAEGRQRLGDNRVARQLLEEATLAQPDLTRAHLLLAGVYEELGEPDLAVERYRRVLALTPDEPISLNNLAHALAVHKSAPGEALPLAQKAYNLSGGKDASIADTLGWIHHLLGNHAEAERLLVSAAAMAPDVAEIHLHLARAYATQGRREPAVAALDKGIQLNPALADRNDVKELRAQLTARRP